MRAMSLALFTFTTSLAFASVNFTGHWKANYGQLSTSFGSKVPCKNIEMQLNHSETAFIIESYKAECNYFGTAWGPNEMQLQGERVIGMQGWEIGTLRENVLITKEKLGTVSHAFNLNLEKDTDGAEILKSHYGIHNAAGLTAIEAELKRVE